MCSRPSCTSCLWLGDCDFHRRQVDWSLILDLDRTPCMPSNYFCSYCPSPRSRPLAADPQHLASLYHPGKCSKTYLSYASEPSYSLVIWQQEEHWMRICFFLSTIHGLTTSRRIATLLLARSEPRRLFRELASNFSDPSSIVYCSF